MSKEAMELALDELKHIKQWCLRSIGIALVNENVLAALEKALAKQEQGKRIWVGLTDDERNEIALEVPMDAVGITEAKLKEKNT